MEKMPKKTYSLLTILSTYESCQRRMSKKFSFESRVTCLTLQLIKTMFDCLKRKEVTLACLTTLQFFFTKIFSKYIK